jgi:hypothetical protein
MARSLTRHNIILAFSKTLLLGSKRRQKRVEIIENSEKLSGFNLKPDS